MNGNGLNSKQEVTNNKEGKREIQVNLKNQLNRDYSIGGILSSLMSQKD